MSTQKPIPYAKILGDRGISYFANKKGFVTIPSKNANAFVDVFGFENKKIIDGEKKYYLKPLTKDQQNSTTFSGAESKIIGKINKNASSSIVGMPYVIFLNFFENKQIAQQSFIRKIRFYSNVESKNSAAVNIVLYENENGFPGKKIENFLTICSPGKKINVIQLRDNLIHFPKKGIFVGYEWIINEENTYKFNFVHRNNTSLNTNHSTMVYNPKIFVQESEKNEVFMMQGEKWSEFKNFKPNKDDKENSNIRLSIEIEIIN